MKNTNFEQLYELYQMGEIDESEFLVGGNMKLDRYEKIYRTKGDDRHEN
ncbi:hypothetical protein [Thermoactinomyces sp. CICC 23799]|jgi:hypothetical protein|nr:hypothetical protein [Thermoactinomyces sp. CICC 23799]MBH8601470.1 hypothetical protein [Thermoactinomyces sp. CICC 23799]